LVKDPITNNTLLGLLVIWYQVVKLKTAMNIHIQCVGMADYSDISMEGVNIPSMAAYLTANALFGNRFQQHIDISMLIIWNGRLSYVNL
jgi:hypothetical protein